MDYIIEYIKYDLSLFCIIFCLVAKVADVLEDIFL